MNILTGLVLLSYFASVPARAANSRLPSPRRATYTEYSKIEFVIEKAKESLVKAEDSEKKANKQNVVVDTRCGDGGFWRWWNERVDSDCRSVAPA